MSKILIIDDRAERKKNFLSDNEIEILKKEAILKSDLQTMTTNDLRQVFAEYDLVAVHRSWLQTLGGNIDNELKEIAANEHKYLILFSGGIDQKLILNDYVAVINSADFYKSRLIDFIQIFNKGNMKNPLLRLLYGESWKLSIWLDLRDIYWRCNNEIDEANEETIDSLLNMLQENSSPDEWYVEKITAKINNEKYNFTQS